MIDRPNYYVQSEIDRIVTDLASVSEVAPKWMDDTQQATAFIQDRDRDKANQAMERFRGDAEENIRRERDRALYAAGDVYEPAFSDLIDGQTAVDDAIWDLITGATGGVGGLFGMIGGLPSIHLNIVNTIEESVFSSIFGWMGDALAQASNGFNPALEWFAEQLRGMLAIPVTLLFELFRDFFFEEGE